MAELQKMIKASNGAFKSDLVKSFVAKHKGDFPQSPASPGFNQNVTTGTGGAGIFTTTSTSTTTTGGTDNANIILRQDNLTDNNQTSNTTSTTPLILENQNNGNLNANVNLNTTKSSSKASPEQPDTNANPSEVNAVLEEVCGSMSEARQMLVQQVTDATVDAHLATCMNTLKAVAEARARFMAMKEAGQLPDMSKLSLSGGSLWEKMMDQMMPELGKTIQFFKMLPAFSELGPDDQMKLIMQGSFEVMMTRFSMLIDHEKETMLDPSHKMVCPRAVIKETPMGTFMDGFFYVGAQFNPIGLSDNEIGLFTATLVFSPCRHGLTDVKLISTIQSLYHQALFNLLKQNHSDSEEKLRKVLGLVPMFRRMNEEHSKALSGMKQQSPDAFDKNFPPLHKDMFSAESQSQ